MKCLTKIGFTLVELMVVIAIIGVLAVALTTQVTKIQDSARATKCKANLRGLAQAAQNYGIQEGYYPLAGSIEILPTHRIPPRYHGRRGWVSWTRGNSDAWPWGNQNESPNSHRNEMDRETWLDEKSYLSITNGELWRLVGKDIDIYRCDKHKGTGKGKIYRSYVMNGYFNYDKGGVQYTSEGRHAVENAVMDGKSAIRLMFAELPAQDTKTTQEFTDSVLEYEMNGDSNTKSESIGFNHFIAKRWVGHVAFVDGHVEGIVLPNKAKKGDGTPDYSHKDLINLTGQLCDGQEITSDLRATMQ